MFLEIKSQGERKWPTEWQNWRMAVNSPMTYSAFFNYWNYVVLPQPKK